MGVVKGFINTDIDTYTAAQDEKYLVVMTAHTELSHN